MNLFNFFKSKPAVTSLKSSGKPVDVVCHVSVPPQHVTSLEIFFSKKLSEAPYTKGDGFTAEETGTIDAEIYSIGNYNNVTVYCVGPKIYEA